MLWLTEAVQSYVKEDYLRLHVPWHGGGYGAPPLLLSAWGENLFRWDVTELPGLDNLHQAQGVIARAQKNIAAIFGAKQSFFLINGASVGIVASLTGVLRPGEKVLLVRNCHRSAVAGLIISGAEPVYLRPEVTGDDLVAGPNSSEIKKVLAVHGDCRVMLGVRPTYYGTCWDLKPMVELVRSRQMVVVIDEAHGTHLYFHPRLPLPALKAGADVVIHSVHKSGGSLTQTALLHLGSSPGGELLIEVNRIQEALHLLQSTSPSYPLLCSLESACAFLAEEGEKHIDRLLTVAAWLREKLQAIPGVRVVGEKMEGKDGSLVVQDPLRLVIDVAEWGVPATMVADLLLERYRIALEMADNRYLLALLPLGMDERQLVRLVEALSLLRQELSEGNSSRKPEKNANNWQRRSLLAQLPIPPMRLIPREAWLARGVKLPLTKAVGRIARQWLAVYPPGVAVLVPGEEISREIVEFIREARVAGLSLQGLPVAGEEKIEVIT